MKKLILLGVGGSTSSGKTTLSKNLLKILPKSTFLIHQDDFAPPSSLLPVDENGIPNWDDPDHSIDWTMLENTLRYVKKFGELPSTHKSHDHLNPESQSTLISPYLNDVEMDMKKKFEESLPFLYESDDYRFVILDGFLCYYNEVVRNLIDIRFILDADKDTLKERRTNRNGYATAEGDIWIDPPNYFDDIVWPSYIKAHKHLFIDNNPSKGLNPDNEFSLKVYNSSTTHMDIILSNVVNDIINYFN